MATLIKGNKQYALVVDEEELAFIAAMANKGWGRNGITTNPDDTIYRELYNKKYYDNNKRFHVYHPEGSIKWKGD